MRLFVATAAVFAVWFAALPSAPTAAAGTDTYISGGTLPYEIRFAAADADAFLRRLNPPPRLDDPPAVSAASYTIRSAYWATIMPGIEGVREPAGEAAAYYPEGGYVSAPRSDGTTTWLVLDIRQQAIIDRYIRLGEIGLLPPAPSIANILYQELVLHQELDKGGPVGLEVAGRYLTGAQTRAVLEEMNAQTRRPDPSTEPPGPSINSLWLTFTLPEGRSVRLLYVAADSRVIDFAAGEYYAVPERWLERVAGGVIAPLTVPQDQGPGSPLWWVIAAAVAAVLLAIALWLNGRIGSRPGAQSRQEL